MHWLQLKKPQLLKLYRCWKNQEKTPKTIIFEKIVIFWGFSWFFQQRYIEKSWGFLRCNQCIQTLHLSYQTPPYDDFHFSGYNGFLQFFRPPLPGVKHNFFFFVKIFSVFLWHKAYKTIQKRTSVWIVPPCTRNQSILLLLSLTTTFLPGLFVVTFRGKTKKIRIAQKNLLLDIWEDIVPVSGYCFQFFRMLEFFKNRISPYHTKNFF